MLFMNWLVRKLFNVLSMKVIVNVIYLRSGSNVIGCLGSYLYTDHEVDWLVWQLFEIYTD